MTYAIDVKELSKTIGKQTILNNISMRVKSGEFYGFLGANGAGKTSLIMSLYQMMIPDCGTVKLLGEPVANGQNDVFAQIGALLKRLFSMKILMHEKICIFMPNIWVQGQNGLPKCLVSLI